MSENPRHDDAARLAARARAAAAHLRRATTAQKDKVLTCVADLLVEERARVVAANAEDLAEAAAASVDAAFLERLRLDARGVDALARAVRAVVALPDPVGAIDALTPQPSGIVVGRMRVPLGTILMIYESRPNVTIDAAALCLKAGNAVILRGGKESRRTNQVLGALTARALEEAGLPADAATVVDDPDRALLYALLAQTGLIDLAIPRGGTSLIDAVNAHAKVPVIQHYQGICHVYVHAAADVDVATRIAVNAKVQRPGVCNAMEGLVVDEAVAARFLPGALAALAAHGVELRGCARTKAHAPAGVTVHDATPRDYDTEFLRLALAVKVVDDYDDALAFIAAHGTLHTEAIVTTDHDAAMRFVRDVDASCVVVNASTRFNDGGELGLGAELGISTTKLHAYGPMGLLELCAKKFVVLGHGETRGTPP